MVSLKLQNVTPRDVLYYLSLMYALTIKVTDRAVIVANKTVPLNEYETCFYNIAPGVFDARRTLSSMNGISSYATGTNGSSNNDNNSRFTQECPSGMGEKPPSTAQQLIAKMTVQMVTR